jgi:hypothetical protein
MKTILIAHVSTEEQREARNSLPAQKPFDLIVKTTDSKLWLSLINMCRNGEIKFDFRLG